MIRSIFLLVCLITTFNLQAEEKKTNLKFMDIKEAISSDLYKKAITSKIPYYFGDEKHPEIDKTLTEASSTRKINVTVKFGNNSCIAAFLETLAALQKTAEGYKADAIVNIQSNFEGNTLDSSNNYLCDPGFFVAGVGLKADVVTFKK